MNSLNHPSTHETINHDLMNLHTHSKTPSITHFVRSSPASASPLMIFKSLSQSEDGLIKILRLIESSVKSYLYLTTWIRPSDPKSIKNSSRIRTAKILIGLSFISIIHRSKELIKIIQAKFSESHSNQSGPFLPPQTSKDRSSPSNKLKSALESVSNSLEVIINLLDDFTFFNHLGLFKICSVKSVWIQISNFLNVILNIINYSKSSIEKAEVWKIGQDARTLMLETDRIIKLNQRAIQSQSNLSLSAGSSTIRPSRSEHGADEEDSNQPASIQDQINLDLKLNRSRKLILKNCKRSLDRIFWSRIVFLIDGLVSAYDLLEVQCVSHGVRTLIELIRSTLDFKLSYSLALQSYSADPYEVGRSYTKAMPQNTITCHI